MPSSPLVLDLAIITAVTFASWRYRTNARVMAAGFWLVAFFVAMAVPSLTGAIAYSIKGPLGVAVVVGLAIYGGYVAAHEVWTGKHHHPVRTQVFCMLGGLTLAGIYVGWPQVSQQLKHLPSETVQALGNSASSARAHSTTMGPQQVKNTLIFAAIGIAVVTFLLWRHHQSRVKEVAGSAVAAVEQAKISKRQARGRRANAQAKAELQRAQVQVKRAGQQMMTVKPLRQLRTGQIARKMWGVTGKKGGARMGGSASQGPRAGALGRPTQVYGPTDDADYGPPTGAPAITQGRRR